MLIAVLFMGVIAGALQAQIYTYTACKPAPR